MVNHSREHLQKNLEEFVNSPQRSVEQIEFRPVAAPGGGLIHAAYIMYNEVKPKVGPCEHCASAGTNNPRNDE